MPRRPFLLKEQNNPRIANGVGWQSFTAQAYKGVSIDDIEDNAGAHKTRRITSYPTPLARMHFFDDAFEFVHAQNNETGNTVFHEAVSHCLDIWEMLFNHEVFKDDLSFVEWELSNITTLSNSTNESHQLLGRSLDLFLRQDKSEQLDKAFSKLYLIKYKNVLIAGSSPFTGFFTVEFDKNEDGNSILPSGIEITVPGKPDLKYFTTIRGISERAESFQAYLMLLFKSHTHLSTYFEHLHSYIERYTLRTNEINRIIGSKPNQLLLEYNATEDVLYNINGTNKRLNLLDTTLMYTQTPVAHAGGQSTIGPQNGIDIKKRQLALPNNCDFIIDSPNNTEKILALTELPSGRTKTYVDFPWDNDIKVRHHYGEHYMDRQLPSWNIKHPFLVLSDLIEEYLVEVPYDINDDSFETFTDGGDSRFLIPIKPLYFKFFKIEDLKRTLTINIQGGGLDKKVIVSLNIPLVNNHYITFSREYEYPENPHEVRTYENIWASQQGKGVIVNYSVGVLIFPFLKTNKPAYNDFYKVACIDGNLDIQETVDLSFYEQGVEGEIPLADARLIKKERVPKGYGSQESGSTYYEHIGAGFDFIRVKLPLNRDNRVISGLVIPKWRTVNINAGSYTFAVDFGTTNSHIAYKEGNVQTTTIDPKKFTSMVPANLLVQRLDKATVLNQHTTASESYDSKSGNDDVFIDRIVRTQRQEFIPSVLGGLYTFPFRTAVAQAVTQPVNAGGFNMFGNTNIAFSLNRRIQNIDNNKPTLRIFTDLKWGNDANTRERVKVFIQEILYLIRAKVLSESSDPAQTNIYWFTPLNMSPSIYQNLQNTWTTEFRRIFHTTRTPISLSESEAPYYAARVGTNEVMTIDIGGMTTDMLYIAGKMPIFGSSFSFAGNAIYGDFPNDTIQGESNGFVRAFSEPIKQRLDTLINSTHDDYQKALYGEAKSTLESYLGDNSMRSDDIVSLFYSNPSFGFTDLLRNSNDFKIIFLLQYTGILYHCATLMENTENLSPGDIIFSGNGSKIFKVIPNQDNALNKIATKVFSHVTKVQRSINVRTIPEPKEASCIGALKSGLSAAKKPNSALKKIILGENIKWDGKAPNEPTYLEIQQARKNFSPTDSEYYKFVDLFIQIYQDLNLSDTYGIQIDLANLKAILKNDDDTARYHFQGTDWAIRKGAVIGQPIIETVFFYPLIGAINKLTAALANKKTGEASLL